MKVGFQGTRGAYSEVALRHFFGKDVEAIGFKLSEEVFEATTNGLVDAAILPVENSIVGNVNVNMDLKYRYDLSMIGEVYLEIRHCLLGHQASEIQNIKRAYSHPVALAQCRTFLNTRQIDPIPHYDTAGSAKNLAKNQNVQESVVGPKLCAQLYDLKILQENIQDVDQNITRFLVFVTQDKVPKELPGEKISLAFQAKHEPGALLKCLKTFAKFELNMTKLESRPIPENPFQYVFFVDLQGNLNDSYVSHCLTELNELAQSVKIFGNYPMGQTYS